jgi:hypothetical protein
MSESVKPSTGPNITASFGGSSSNISASRPNSTGYLFDHTVSYGINVLAQLKNIYNDTTSTAGNGYFQMTNVIDNGTEPAANGTDPKYPANWGYTSYAKSNGNAANPNVFIPPHKLLTVAMMTSLAGNQGSTITPSATFTVTRRVTDVLVSSPPDRTASLNYFTWPVWARFKKDMNVPPANDVFWGQKPTETGIIWQFDGTNYLETSDEDLELQARINDNLSAPPVLFWTTSDIPAEYRNPHAAADAGKKGGLWLPNVINPLLYYYVPMSGGINSKSANSSSSKLFNYVLTAGSFSTDSGVKFEFIFRITNSSDMFAARLDIPRDSTIPANWYTLLRPFVFEIRNLRRQRGGVTIMNNVINSNNRETAVIRYILARPGRVTVQIYTLEGTLVKSLRRGEQRDAGEWTDTWDGTNNGGKAVARGMYFVRVVGPDIDEIRKIMVVK